MQPFIAKVSNGAADFTEFCWDNTSSLVVPTALGGVGGWLTGVGTGLGAVQGATSGALFSWVLRPAWHYISKNEGNGPEQFHPNAVTMARLIGGVGNIAIPILLTMYFGVSVVNLIPDVAPLSWVITKVGMHEYTFIMGIFVNLAPAATQWGIELLRKDENRRF